MSSDRLASEFFNFFSNLSESLMYYIHSTALQTIRFPLGWTERLFNVVENSWHCNAYLYWCLTSS